APSPAGELGVAGVVGVLHPPNRVVDVPAAVREVRLRANLGTPGEELVGAEPVAFLLTPGQLEPTWPLVAGADAVLPVVRRGEVAARPAHERHTELAAELENVSAQPVAVARLVDRQRRSFVEDAALDVAEERR